MDLNAEIAERIMGWEVHRTERTYRDPTQQLGFLERLPDFLLGDQELLRQRMKTLGYELTVTENPPDIPKGMGKTFTASFSRKTESFQITESGENLAVCVAALKAYGFPSDR
jgi:hypothetical protein